jgi:enamine deaminase RidA (YjgF/YER057c/UK114 family)
MAGRIAARLAEMGVTLPVAPAPVANYLPFMKTGNLVHTAGQIPVVDGKVMFKGALGTDAVTVADGQAAARLCMVNMLSQLVRATDGNLDRISKIVKINVFVSSTPDFTQQPAVANGASDFLVEVFGEMGRHARSAVGVAALPLGCSVEIDAIFELDGATQSSL